jgi:hypothetical protein
MFHGGQREKGKRKKWEKRIISGASLFGIDDDGADNPAYLFGFLNERTIFFFGGG